MKKLYVVTVLLVTLVAAGYLFAQSESDYQGWMKGNGAAMGALNKALAAKDGGAAASEAGKLEANLKQVEAFWEKKGGAPDAVTFAKNGQMAAMAVAKAAGGGNMEEAGTELKKLQGNCGGCHMAHREGAAGAFKFK